MPIKMPSEYVSPSFGWKLCTWVVHEKWGGGAAGWAGGWLMVGKMEEREIQRKGYMEGEGDKGRVGGEG